MPNMFSKKVVEEKQEKPPLMELTWDELFVDFDRDMEIYATNPDTILEKMGWDFYKEVALDDTVHSCLEIKKTARLSTPWHLEPYSEDNIDQRIAKYVEDQFKGMKGTFRKNLKSVYSAFDYGFSGSEINLKYIEKGEWKGKVGLKNIKARDPEYLFFNTDKHGNLNHLYQNFGFKEGKPIPQDKMIIYTPMPGFGNMAHTGQGAGRFVYKPYISKKWVTRFWMIALERFGMPITVGKYPAGSKPQKKYLEKVLKNMQAKVSMVIEDTMSVDTLDATPGGKMAYEAALDKYNTAMSRALLIPDLLGFSEFTKGSYALGKKHFDIFLMDLDEIGRDTEEDITDEQLIKLLVGYNWNTGNIPHFKFDPLTEENKSETVGTWKDAVVGGAVTNTEEDEEYTRRLLGYPIPEKTDKTFHYAKTRQKTKAHGVVNFTKVKKDWDDLEEQTDNDLYAVMEKTKTTLLNMLEKKGYLNVDTPPSPNSIEKIQLKYVGDFKIALEKGMLLAYLNSKHTALEELWKLGAPLPTKFSELETTLGLDAVQALKFFKGKIPISKAELEYYVRKAFTVAGVEKEAILGKIKIILYQHLKGKDKRKTLKKLNKLFDKYILTGELRPDKIGNYELLSGYHIRTVVRNNIGEAMSEGRKTMYEDPMVANEIEAYTISATIDSRTTDFCQSVDGLVYSKEEMDFPPYHDNCRTIALPVMRGEEYKLDTWKPTPYERFQ